MRVMQVLGIEYPDCDQRAGGLRPDFRAGDVMFIDDHINLIGMGGASPL